MSPAPQLGRGTPGLMASTSLVPTKEKHFIEKASQLLAFYIGQNLCKRFHMVRVIAGNTWKSSDQRKAARIPSPLSENPGSLFLFWRIAFWKWWKPSKLTPKICFHGNSNAAVFMGYLSLHQYLIPGQWVCRLLPSVFALAELSCNTNLVKYNRNISCIHWYRLNPQVTVKAHN